MRTINLKIVLTDDDKIGTLEQATGLPADKIESHLLLIGLYENLKQKHLDKLKTQFEKTVRKQPDGLDL
jgi:hypothetical protein